MKKIVVIMFCLLMLFGCGKKEAEVEANTVGTKQLAVFKASKESDINSIASELIDNAEADLNLISMEVEPGYLNGFSEEVNGFKKGIVISPMIGAIPYVTYVFETDNADALVDELNKKADKRWNICTEADELVVEAKDNLVFFIMCSNED